MKTATVQYGTNSVLKHKNETIEEIFKPDQELIKQIKPNHEPERIFFCETPSKFYSEE